MALKKLLVLGSMLLSWGWVEGSETRNSTPPPTEEEIEQELKDSYQSIERGRKIAMLAYQPIVSQENNAAANSYAFNHIRETGEDLKKLTSIKGFEGETGWSLWPLMKKKTSHCGFIAEEKYSVIDKDNEGKELHQEKEHFIVSIRGTRMRSWNDWKTNFNLHLIKAPEDLGLNAPKAKVHNGFYEYGKSIFNNIWPELETRIIIKINKSFPNLQFDKIWPEYEIRQNYAEKKQLIFSTFNDFLKKIKEKNVKNTDEILNQYKEHCVKILSEIKFSVYGHSLGGGGTHVVSLLIKKAIKDAINKIGGTDIPEPKDNVEVFTYESPRAFNKAGATAFDGIIGKENHIRVIQKDERSFFRKLIGLKQDGRKHVWNTDPVTSVPPGFKGLWYKHTGTLCVIYITKETSARAGDVLHTMVPIENTKECIEAGRRHKSNGYVFERKARHTLEDIGKYISKIVQNKKGMIEVQTKSHESNVHQNSVLHGDVEIFVGDQ